MIGLRWPDALLSPGFHGVSSRFVCRAALPTKFGGGETMPEKKTRKRAAKDKRQGKSGSTQGGEYVREEIHHVREGKHGARSTKQAIAIGLSKARRAGVKVPSPKGKAAKKRARQESARKGRKPSSTRAW